MTRTKIPDQKSSKYKNVKTEYEGQTFDSKFELETYKHLIRLFGKEKVERQVKLQLCPKSKNFTATHLIVDFAILREDDGGSRYEFFVETKGRLTPECLIKLKWLDSKSSRGFKSIHFIVKGKSNLPKVCKTVSINQLEECQQDGIRNLFQKG